MINILFNSSYIYVPETLECNKTNTFVGKFWPPAVCNFFLYSMAHPVVNLVVFMVSL